MKNLFHNIISFISAKVDVIFIFVVFDDVDVNDVDIDINADINKNVENSSMLMISS